jgi:hypothetical protein
MPRNNSGTYNRSQADYVPGTTILATAVNLDLNDMAQALTDSLARDGQTTPTANIPLGGFRIINLGNGTSATDAATLGQVDGRAEIDLASASTTNIGAEASNNVRITGTTTITSFGTAASGITRQLRFAASVTLTYNATSLILPGNSNITTHAGDTATAVSLGSGNWVIVSFQRRSANPTNATAAPIPIAAAGLGQVQALYAGNNTALNLPAGGIWFWFYIQRVVSSLGVQSTSIGISEGGLNIATATVGLDHLGWCWRIG